MELRAEPDVVVLPRRRRVERVVRAHAAGLDGDLVRHRDWPASSASDSAGRRCCCTSYQYPVAAALRDHHAVALFEVGDDVGGRRARRRHDRAGSRAARARGAAAVPRRAAVPAACRRAVPLPPVPPVPARRRARRAADAGRAGRAARARRAALPVVPPVPVVAVHALFMQVCAARADVVQLPQCWLSLLTLRQVPLHSIWPAIGQVQAPFWHVVPPEQTLPQVPQLAVAGGVRARAARALASRPRRSRWSRRCCCRPCVPEQVDAAGAAVAARWLTQAPLQSRSPGPHLHAPA